MRFVLRCIPLLLLLTLPGLTAAQPSPAPFRLERQGTYQSLVFDAGAAEIAAYDPVSQTVFFTNADANTLGVLDVSNPAMPTLRASIDLSPYGAGVNSVTYAGGTLAVAVEADPATDPGQVVFFDTDGNVLGQVTVGSLPDMVAFTPDGSKVVVANEGEPNDDYTIDPEGSVSIIDLSGGIAAASVTTVSFADFNAGGPRSAELPAGVRIFGPNASVAQDLEPEYVAISDDGTTAYVTLQENNAIAVVDLDAGAVTSIWALGVKDHRLPGHGLDASNRDEGIRIENGPVYGLYQPDAIAYVEIDGQGYLVTANEGDARDYDGFAEEERVADLSLDPTAFPEAASLQAADRLGRLTVTTATGDTDGDGDFDALYAFGARSFSIWNASTGALVFDSGDDLEQRLAGLLPEQFNSTNDENQSFDSRSDDKGPEPEAVTVGSFNGRVYAFLGLERIGGVMVYDITEPTAPAFVTYANHRDFSVRFATDEDGDPAPTPTQLQAVGDLGPEQVLFVPAAQSPSGRPLLVVPNEVSGSISLFDLAPAEPTDLLITGVLDGPLPGGLPKVVELYALDDIADLSAYGLGSANNGDGTDGQEFTFPAEPVTAGTYLYVTSTGGESAFETFFGFAPSYTSDAVFINGDDAVELFKDGLVVDVFGDRFVDGNGTAWEYLDGWAYRKAGTGPDGGLFVAEHWTYSGPDALDGAETNATAATPFPIGTYDRAFTLQVLHAADQEAGIPAVEDAIRFSAVMEGLAASMDHTIRLTSGDLYIPGPFFSAGEAVYGGAGIADVLINNALGWHAAAFGNHEFDLGTATVARLLQPDPALTLTGVPDVTTYPGTALPYLSANLDVTTDANLAGLRVADGNPPQPGTIARSVVLTVGGNRIGVVGATTPRLDVISSPGDVTVTPPLRGDGSEDIAALAAIIQASVDALTADGVDKIILLAHMQQIGIEEQLAQALRDVDLIIAGGSNTLLADEDDPLRTGDSREGDYPIALTSAAGEPVYVVNTDGNYTYVGRFIATFDGHGVITTVDPASGAYATDAAGVNRVYGADVDPRDVAHPVVVAVADAVRENVLARDANLFGRTAVFLNGTRGSVRQQETNLGNLTADANLAVARQYDPSVRIALKNGGGIRDNIGVEIVPAGGTDYVQLPPPANPLAGKDEGDISQLDIENALRFNNGLTLLTVTAEELRALIEHGVGASDFPPTATPGRFPQVSGLRFSFDATRPAGDRVRNLVVLDELGAAADVVVRDGTLQGDPSRTFRLVTLNFLADGGDGYPFPAGEAARRLDLVGEPLPSGAWNVASFAPDGSEQDALAEYLAARFPSDDDPATPAFDVADTAPGEDERIQNLGFRADGVLDETGTHREDAPGLPVSFTLEQNYPNPFNPTTTIRFGLPQSTDVRLAVYDMLGRRVTTLVDAPHPAGWHEVAFDASRLASGVYFYRIEAGTFSQTHTMLLVK